MNVFFGLGDSLKVLQFKLNGLVGRLLADVAESMNEDDGDEEDKGSALISMGFHYYFFFFFLFSYSSPIGIYKYEGRETIKTTNETKKEIKFTDSNTILR